jgi:predicted nuclease with TOPRIM domain
MSERKRDQLEEELKIMKDKNEDLKAQYASKNHKKQYKEHIQCLEAKFREIKENSSKIQQKLEETVFENDQLVQTVEELKKELVETNEKLSVERKSKHELEL